MKSKIHTTNYFDTFIAIADDSLMSHGTLPKQKEDQQTIAAMQFELIAQKPYAFTSDDVLFKVFAKRNNIAKEDEKVAREVFFAKGQPCFRASPLTKKHGFGIHANHEGKLAAYGVETAEYQKLAQNPALKQLQAMRSSKK